MVFSPRGDACREVPTESVPVEPRAHSPEKTGEYGVWTPSKASSLAVPRPLGAKSVPPALWPDFYGGARSGRDRCRSRGSAQSSLRHWKAGAVRWRRSHPPAAGFSELVPEPRGDEPCPDPRTRPPL